MILSSTNYSKWSTIITLNVQNFDVETSKSLYGDFYVD